MAANYTGKWGEIYAARHLRDKGYKIESVNYRVRGGEIDIIAGNRDYLVFVEVKTRGQNPFDVPSAAVDYSKQRKITLTAADYLQNFPTDRQPRFDVIEISMDKDYKVTRLRHIEAAFDSQL
ncbi:MAG: YraN family protein [Clostridiales bacterium]|nr:YraN family protein [Clostridiales bacterium]